MLFWVHQALPWVEIESTAVEQDSFFEILEVSINARTLFDGHILTVDPFGYSIHSPCVQKVTMLFQVASLRSKRLLLHFIFMPPIFMPSFPTAGIRRRIGKKMRSK